MVEIVVVQQFEKYVFWTGFFNIIWKLYEICCKRLIYALKRVVYSVGLLWK